MAVLEKLEFLDVHGTPRTVHFCSNATTQQGVQWTILTGRNGSYKSTVFREIVKGIILSKLGQQTSLIFRDTDKVTNSDPRVIAISGTVSDRFPLKHPTIKTTIFDQPNYLYFGQRINANIISKREIIERAISYVLDGKTKQRLSQRFYRDIFSLIGLKPIVELKIEHTNPSTQKRRSNQLPLFETLTNVANGRSQIGAGTILYSPDSARFLLSEFSSSTFAELHRFLTGSRRTIDVVISDFVKTSGLDAEAIRLGLHTDQLKLKSVTVASAKQDNKFSAFDLSSGEYHLWSTLLAACFCTKSGDVVLIDEPETSLHPQWQIDYMRLLQGVTSHMKDGHILISTHSPLIISAGKPGSVVVDVSEQESSIAEITGNFSGSADDILVDTFGIKSSRNHYFVDKLQRAIQLVEQGKDSGEEFESLTKILSTYRASIPQTDPIIDIIDALITIE